MMNAGQWIQLAVVLVGGLIAYFKSMREIDNKFAGMAVQLARIEERLTGVEKELARIDERLKKVEAAA